MLFLFVAFSDIFVRSFGAKNISFFYKVHSFPNLFKFTLDLYAFDSLFNSQSYLKVKRFGEKTYLPIRIFTIDSIDMRIFGRGMMNITECINVDLDTDWQDGDQCNFTTRAQIIGSSMFTPIDTYIVHWIYRNESYFAEIFVKGHLACRITNYPINQHRVGRLIYNPASMIMCGANDDSFLHWVNMKTMDNYANPFVINDTSFVKCDRNYSPHYYKLQCRVNARPLFRISFEILHCYHIFFETGNVKNRLVYDAGEEVHCGIQPIIIFPVIYFSPLYPPVVNMVIGTNLTKNDYKFRIPENLKKCSNCKLICGFSNPINSYYLWDQTITIEILTQFETVLERPNKTWTRSVPYLYYDEEFRCVQSRYRENVRTTVVKYDFPIPPYSNLILDENNQKYSSLPNSWFKLNESFYERFGRNNWLVYCLISDSLITTPISYVFHTSRESWIKIDLWYPFPDLPIKVLEGFVFKCQGYKVYTIMDCLEACDAVELKNFPIKSFSVAIIKGIFKEISIKIKCLGYLTLHDPNPLVEIKTFTAYPSELQTIPNTVPYNVDLYTRRYYHVGDIYNYVYYDSVLTFTKAGYKPRNHRTNVNRNINTITIPTEYLSDTIVTFCYIDTVNDQGELDCSMYNVRVINIITSIEVIYTPRLIENKINYVESGSSISCRICIIYNKENRRACVTNNKLTISIYKPRHSMEIKKGYRNIQLPEADDAEIFNWNFTLTCYLSSLNISWRFIKIQSCSELIILPEEKEIFHLNDTVECKFRSSKCSKDNYFHIMVFTENILTLEIATGVGVYLDSRFLGVNQFICSVYSNRSIFVEKKVILESAPTYIEIINRKSVLTVGDLLTCDGKGYPYPSMEWWFISGSKALKLFDNHLMILPNSKSGKYIYECVVQNFYGELKERTHFYLYNKYRKIYEKKIDNSQFYIYYSLIFVLFIVLFMTCNQFVFGYHYVPNTRLAA